MRTDLKLVIGGESMGGSLYKLTCIWEAAFTELYVEKEQQCTLSWRLQLIIINNQLSDEQCLV